MRRSLLSSPDPIAVTDSLAVVCTPVAPLNAEPRVSASQTSQALRGAVLDVLESHGDWLRVRGADAYDGWVHGGYLQRPPAADGFRPDRISLGCRVRRADGRAWVLPLGAAVMADAPRLDGETVAIGSERDVAFPADATAIIASARRFYEGARYEWGGLTPWGADCSGLVQSVFSLHGVALPRDAWQQALEGSDAGSSIGALRAGDLLFFSEREDRRVTHVALSIGGARIVHLALGRGGWAEDVLGGPDAYTQRLATNFLFARRVLG